MISERKAANALGGKTARACDGCLRKRARWFCPADDAFLCQACDASVHSANQLASRHSRVWLEAVPSKTISGLTSTEGSNFSPTWHQGFTRKARTPRHKSNRNILVDQEQVKDEEKVLNPLPLVPEIGNEEGNLIADDNEDDQLLCRVPVFDPFEEGLCDILTSKGPETDIGNEVGKAIIEDYYGQEDGVDDSDYFSGFQLPSDMDLAKFAADVDNLLGSEFDEQEDDYSLNKELGLEECEQGTKGKFSSMEKAVKVKDEAITDGRFDPSWPDHRNFDFELPVLDEAGGEEEEEKPVPVAGMVEDKTKEEMKKKIFLRLNYEAVITAWASQGSPRTTGSWPQLSSNSCLPSSVGACPKDAHQAYGGLGCRSRGVDEGREARVMRYKEKRRTRLFSKKIRYEVRKLNAEKRPRMKGRFVKRTSFVGTAFPYLSFSK